MPVRPPDVQFQRPRRPDRLHRHRAAAHRRAGRRRDPRRDLGGRPALSGRRRDHRRRARRGPRPPPRHAGKVDPTRYAADQWIGDLAVSSGTGRTTLATVAASAGVSVATVSKVHQRPHGRRPVHPGADPGPAAPARVRRAAAAARRAAARSRCSSRTTLVIYSTEILNGVLDAAARSRRLRGRRRSEHPEDRKSRAVGLGPRPGRRRPQGGRRGDQRADGCGPERAVASPGPARRHRRAEHAARPGDQRRLDQLRRWRRGHGAPALARTSPDRLPRRAALGGLQPGADARLPRHDARAPGCR